MFKSRNKCPICDDNLRQFAGNNYYYWCNKCDDKYEDKILTGCIYQTHFFYGKNSINQQSFIADETILMPAQDISIGINYGISEVEIDIYSLSIQQRINKSIKDISTLADAAIQLWKLPIKNNRKYIIPNFYINETLMNIKNVCKVLKYPWCEDNNLFNDPMYWE